MNEKNNIDLKKLQLLIFELQQNSENYENITFEELEKIYQKKFKTTSKINNDNNSEKGNQLTYDQTKKEITRRINNLFEIINKNNIKTKIITFFSEEYIKIVMDKKINRKQKIEKLNQLGDKVDVCQKNVNEIAIYLNEIKQKIVKIDSMYTYSKRYIEIYQSQKLLVLKEKLSIMLNSIDINNPITLKQLSDFSKELDEIFLTLNKLYELSKYRKNDFFSRHKFEYNLNGITIKVDIEEKTYEISYNEKLIEYLKKYKITKLKRLLEQSLKFTQFNEIIEPKYVNEKQLSEFIKNNNIPLEKILKYDIEKLIKYLSLENEIDSEPTIEELSEKNEDIKNVFVLLNILNSQGFETYIGKENVLIEDIIKIYQNIDIKKNENIYKIITPVIFSRYPKEIYLYSSLQNVYNCINPILRQAIHNDLEKNKKTSNVIQIIEFMKKYSRNKDGNEYQDDEIINFLKQKNEIINTKYSLDQEMFEEYKESTNVNEDMDKILYRITGKRR